ncbi:MAG TPA: multicopper oxidase family protein [Burkholderiaceae bacterium]|nr:multicopper oxidase family protein [Burkholderiaceae bacterium]
MKRLFPLLLGAAAGLVIGTAHAAVPGITGTNGAAGSAVFNLSAGEAYLNEPDGQTVYSWGYGCTSGTSPTFAPAAVVGAFCSTMQIPGPTLIVTEGQTVSVTLTNNLPPAAGNTSLMFPGFNVTAAAASGQAATCATATNGLLATEAAHGCSVTYTFVAGSPGTRAYYSGTQGDLQVEMGLFGAIVVLPNKVPSVCSGGLPTTNPGANLAASQARGEHDFRLAASAFDHPSTCYDREYLFQFSEMDPRIHNAAMFQVQSKASCTAGSAGCSLEIPTEPYHPAYFMINGRSMPDDMDPNYVPGFPYQPYNGNPHMHPGEVTLLRIIGQGRWQHPFHEHANHVRVLARDGNLLLSSADTYNPATGSGNAALAGPLMFTTTTTPGQAMDGLFYYTAKGLNWDMYGHNPSSTDPAAKLPCTPDANGYNTADPKALNYFEWCQDHNKPLQAHPFGDVSAGGPMTLPNPNVFVNGTWYGGSPYLGPDATSRATYGTCASTTSTTGVLSTTCSTTGTTLPSGTIANSPSLEAGFAFMWHSHNEREITTNNIFPGGMLMMMLVDSREFVIDESQ